MLVWFGPYMAWTGKRVDILSQLSCRVVWFFFRTQSEGAKTVKINETTLFCVSRQFFCSKYLFNMCLVCIFMWCSVVDYIRFWNPHYEASRSKNLGAEKCFVKWSFNTRAEFREAIKLYSAVVRNYCRYMGKASSEYSTVLEIVNNRTSCIFCMLCF